ncbi:phage exclusion protein Lit family protein [Ralstonia solanacearum]|uniref:phage exclusion protein Lit family protein n=1 Tax=Ralstonia solanacearum TaxID=305 RepID=UPI002F9221C7
MAANGLENSPVLALQGNVLWQWENLSDRAPQQLQREVNKGLLSREIALQMDALPPRGPFIKACKGGPPEIHLQVSFLELLWAFIYGWMVMYEEGVQRPQMPGTELPTGPVPEDLVQRATELHSWARSLAHGYTRWPEHLPSPKDYANEAERYFGEKANLIFQLATTFLLSHERAHAIYGHLLLVDEADDGGALKAQLEKDADIFALDQLVEQGLDDEQKSAQSWAILAVVLASFHANREPCSALRSQDRLPLHHRTAHFIKSLDFKDERYRDYFLLFCWLVFQDLFPQVLCPSATFEDVEEALTDALNRLDALAGTTTSE